ncbi:MAG TPA: IS1 family transposase [Xanthobacteraceae bacterium]|nr:IS1 family transposase [Xanthobacteraceae bacterium]
MNKLPVEKRVQILSMLCEGSSMRSISRVTGVSINTVTKLLVDAGNACAAFHHEAVRNVKAKSVQCDEIWSFNYRKASNLRHASAAPIGSGDVWTWTGIDADSKLIISWHVGDRHHVAAMEFIGDLKARLANKVQLSTDGHKAYLSAVEELDFDTDYAMLIKVFGKEGSVLGSAGRYSPPVVVGTKVQNVRGNPDPRYVNTSYAERQNLTMRMQMRRFTRLTNGFSKKMENHCHALALYFVWYNFIKTHKAHRMTPAMAAGITDKLMDMSDIVSMIEAEEKALPKKRGPYRKKAA